MSGLTPEEIAYEMAHKDDNRGPDLLASYVVCLSLAYAAVVLRLISRKISKVALWWDDWIVVAGLVFTSAQVALGIHGIHLGAGKHVIFVTDPVVFIKGFISIEIVYTVAAALIKFSTLLLYRRIFASNRRLMIACWIVAFVVFAYSTAQTIMAIFQCSPIHKAWEPATPGTCLDPFTAATTPAAVNVVADFATVVLPLPLIWGMHLQWKRKVQLSGIFLLGGFVIFASIWRAATMKLLSHVDISYDNTDPCIWSIVENGVGIISTCLPTLRPLYSLVVRGHYCRSNEYCERCQRSAKGMKNLQPWNSSSSGGYRQGSDESKSPGSLSSSGRRTDVGRQWPLPNTEERQVKVFSIMD